MRRISAYYPATVVSFLSFAIYLLSLGNEFVRWDDSDYVTGNPHIRSFDPAFLKWAFLDFYAANWHPLTWVSHALDYAVWGLNPLGHHLTNNMLHAVNTFLVVLLVVRLIEATKPASWQAGKPTSSQADESASLQAGKLTSSHKSRFTLIVAGVTGLLFGIHPVHVESVAWVAERKDLLCAVFYLLSILSYLKYAADASQRARGTGQRDNTQSAKGKEQSAVPPMRSAPGPMLSALCFFILALLSKPMAVSLPLVLLILDWYPLERVNSLKTFRVAFIEKIPFMVLSVISSVLTVIAQRTGGAMELMEVVPLPARMLVAAKALVAYLENMVMPLKLIPYYPYPKDVSLFNIEYMSAVILVIGFTSVCLVVAKKRKLWLALWAYYVLTLIPVLGIVQVGGQSMADRYTYLPGIGPFLFAGLAAAWISMRLDTLKRWGRGVKIMTATGAALVLLSMTYLTVKQIGVWKNPFTLWDYVIQRNPGSVAVAYQNRGQLFEAMGRLDDALEDYNRAIALKPADYLYHYNRGIVYAKLGRLDNALEDYGRAIALKPAYYDAYVNRGNIHLGLGLTDKALEDYGKAITLDSFRHEAYRNRGVVYMRVGDRRLAVADFQKACELGNEGACRALEQVNAQ